MTRDQAMGLDGRVSSPGKSKEFFTSLNTTRPNLKPTQLLI